MTDSTTTAAHATVTLASADFDTTITSSSVPVLVDFWAEWCGPCKAMAPVLEQVAQDLTGKVVIAKLNIEQDDAAAEIAQKQSIRSIPNLKLFVKGEVVHEFIGYSDYLTFKPQLEAQLAKLAA
jgi:thioredoxin 1